MELVQSIKSLGKHHQQRVHGAERRFEGGEVHLRLLSGTNFMARLNLKRARWPLLTDKPFQDGILPLVSQRDYLLHQPDGRQLRVDLESADNVFPKRVQQLRPGRSRPVPGLRLIAPQVAVHGAAVYPPAFRRWPF